MTTPNYNNIFALYYTMYRVEAVIPTSSDDEYKIGVPLANEAVAHWATYDGVYWQSLFATAQTNSTGGVVTITDGTSSYAAPTAFAEGAGIVKIKNSSGQTVLRYPIIEPQEAQFRDDNSKYAYFTVAAGGAWTLHLNPTPSGMTGQLIDYIFYIKPTEFTTADGTIKSECPNAEYIAHRMLGMRFRGSRNPFAADAKKDAENALATMKMRNDSGGWANPWSVPDHSGSTWGF